MANSDAEMTNLSISEPKRAPGFAWRDLRNVTVHEKVNAHRKTDRTGMIVGWVRGGARGNDDWCANDS